VHVISERKLREFWRKHPAAEEPLRAWHRAVKHVAWQNFAQVRALYPSADQVGKFTVFNIGGNKYRLIAVIHYDYPRVFVRHVLAHAEYSRGNWKDD